MSMKSIKNINKMAQLRPGGACQLRVYHSKAYRKRDSRYLIKCGCCNESVEIYYGGSTLEINGVMDSVQNWREILLPLLNAGKGMDY